MPSTGHKFSADGSRDEFGRPGIEVACGVITDETGRVLLAERPEGKIAAGRWEFAGGKIEPGETARAALARELEEELGLLVREAEPLARLRQDYRDRVVWLNVWRVTASDGEPRPLEGQRLAWVRPEQADHLDLLPSCWRVVAALRLPRNYVFTPPVAPLPEWVDQLDRLPQGALMRLRRPLLGDNEYLREARTLTTTCMKLGLGLVLDRDPCMVTELDAAGWHATAARLSCLCDRPLPRSCERPRWCLASVHDAGELALARERGIDAAVLSPVRPTPTHSSAIALGWPAFGQLVHDAGLPVYALGGIGPAQWPQVCGQGAFGIAGISAYWAPRRLD